MFDQAVRNARLLRADGPRVDIGILDGAIAAIGDSIAGEAHDTVDAAGAILFPGLVDEHVHWNEPGRAEWEGFTTGSSAAAAGGVTTVFDMPLNSSPPVIDFAAFRAKRERGEMKSFVDFAIWAGLVPGNEHEIERLADAGCIGFKAFLCDSGIDEFPACDPDTLATGMKRIAETGLRLAVHAEDPGSLGTGGETIDDFLASRPPRAECAAIERVIDLAGRYSCPVTIVHVTHPDALALIVRARQEGADVTAETCPHYLILDENDLRAIGPAAKCAPPLRPRAAVDAMREALVRGEIDTIGSDHSPAPPWRKNAKPFGAAWGGISSLQHGLPLLWENPAGGDALARLMCGNPARLFALPSKGRLEAGCDADFTLVVPEPGTVEESTLAYRHKITPYIGHATGCRIKQTYLRGELVYDEGRITGPPRGRFQRPER